MNHDRTTVDFTNLHQVDVRAVKLDELVDISTIEIDETMTKEQRIAEFIRQVKNPYCFRVGNVAVSVGFADNGITFEQRMEHYLQTL